MKENVSRNNSVEKGLEVLECFSAEHSYLTLENLVSMTGYPKTTVFRLIKSLEKYGYLKSDHTLKEIHYSLGWVFLRKANFILNQLNIREIARDDLVGLRNRSGLTVQLAMREREQAVYIDQIESLNPIKVYPQVGRTAPLYAAACPRTLLAHLSEGEQANILESIDITTYPRIPSNDKLKEELLTIKSLGYAISYGELHEGTVAVASPVLSRDNQAIAAISVVGLEQDFEKGHLEKCIQLVQECVKKVSMKLSVRI